MVDEHRKIRFSDAAAAVEATPKAFRKMLDNPTLARIFGSHAAKSESGWHDFNLIQIAALAIIRRLVDFGSPIGIASLRACSALLALYRTMLDDDSEHFEASPDTTLGDFLDSISGSLLVLTSDGDVLNDQEVLTTVGLKKRYPSWSLDRSMLIIPIGPVVNRAIARALLGPRIDSSGNERAALIPFNKVLMLYEDILRLTPPREELKSKKTTKEKQPAKSGSTAKKKRL